MAWQVEFRAGVHLPQIAWWLDAHFPQRRSFVSHAHSDHVARHGEILCSAGTSRLMRARLPGERVEHVLPFGQTEQLTTDATVSLHPAGHIHGSAQSLITHEQHGSLLYTGDFKLRVGRSAEPCATPRADVLIMETTFGRPQYVFPPTEDVLRDIAGFCHDCLDDGETPVLFGYSLGKSQELLCGLAADRLPVMLHPQTLRLTRIYEELGITFPAYRGFDANEVAGHVVICPPQSGSSPFLRQIPRRRTAVITGWAMDPGAIYRHQCDAAFPLSDHADFPDLLRFVEAVQPRRVLTLHGFAQDFARTLRERGLEAWAVGEDNQLELAVSVAVGAALPAANAPAATEPDDLAPAPAAPDSPALFAHFARTAEEVKATPRKGEKVAILSRYLGRLDADAAGLAALFFTARVFPQADERTLALGWAVVKRAVLEVAQLSETDYRAASPRFADAGDAAAALLAARRAHAPDLAASPAPAVTLSGLATWFEALAAARGPLAKLDLLRAQLAHLSALEAKYVVKIITGDLRIGLKDGLVEEAIAAAAGRPLETVREANLLSGDIVAVARAARQDTLTAIQLRVFHPLQFMLASPEPTADAILARFAPPVWLEEKYDGIRCQVHKAGDRVELYSRDLKRITAQFPDLVRAVRSLPGAFIADAELLAWRDERALPFAELQKRLGRKGDDFFLGAEIPVSLTFYDLLGRDGTSLLKSSLHERRLALAALVAPAAASRQAQLHLAPVRTARDAIEIEAAFLAARRRGNEGLIAKDPQSAYTPGRRGLAWLKLKKAYATLDVVVVGAEYGHGRRRDVLSDYTFAIRDAEHGRLLTVGKAYSGLTDAEIAQLTAHFLAHTLEVRGRVRRVVPDTILEIAFDSIQPSSRHESGFALRFPRIARIRTDKTVADIDTLETCRRLAAAAPTDGTSAAATAP
jgi:DNA ligase-1